MEIKFTTNQKHINQISDWLFDEEKNNGASFYYNFKCIASRLSEDNFIYIVVDDKAIGFINYSLTTDGRECLIDIACIQNEYRRKGYGQVLLNALIEKLKPKGCLLMYLYCEPKNSKNAWKKLGFNKFENLPYDKKIWMYRPLVEVLKLTRKKKLDNYIALWKKEDGLVREDDKPDVMWDVSNFDKPIIYPANDKWKLKYVKDGKTISSNEVYRTSFTKAESFKFIIINNQK